MGTIRALFAAVERRHLNFENENDGLDAPPVLATHSPPRKQPRRYHMNHPKRHMGDDPGGTSGNPVDGGNNTGVSCHVGLLTFPCSHIHEPHTDASPTDFASSLGGDASSTLITATSAVASTTVSSPASPVSSTPNLTSSSDFETIRLSTDTAATSPTSPDVSAASSSITPNSASTSAVPPLSKSISPQPPPSISLSLSLPPASSASAVDASSSSISSSQAAAAKHDNKTGAIVGGIIGGIVFLLLLILGFILFLRRRRRKRTPASAEFRDYYMPRTGSAPLAAQGSAVNLDETDGPPPPFTQGNFSDPLFEKIQETRQAHIDYGLAI